MTSCLSSTWHQLTWLKCWGLESSLDSLTRLAADLSVGWDCQPEHCVSVWRELPHNLAGFQGQATPDRQREVGRRHITFYELVLMWQSTTSIFDLSYKSQAYPGSRGRDIVSTSQWGVARFWKNCGAGNITKAVEEIYSATWTASGSWLPSIQAVGSLLDLQPHPLLGPLELDNRPSGYSLLECLFLIENCIEIIINVHAIVRNNTERSMDSIQFPQQQHLAKQN